MTIQSSYAISYHYMSYHTITYYHMKLQHITSNQAKSLTITWFVLVFIDKSMYRSLVTKYTCFYSLICMIRFGTQSVIDSITNYHDEFTCFHPLIYMVGFKTQSGYVECFSCDVTSSRGMLFHVMSFYIICLNILSGIKFGNYQVMSC